MLRKMLFGALALKIEIEYMIDSKKSYDVIIIGGGAAGLSAALWCDELGLSALLLEKETEFGGQLLRVYNEIKNHLGTQAADGRDLRDCFVRQIDSRRFEKRLGSIVSFADLNSKIVVLQSGEIFSARALIIASGVKRRKLNVEGEDRFIGKGIIESGKKDNGKSVTGKAVAVIGGGDAALENALIVAETAAKVYLIHRRKNFRGRPEFLEKILRHPKIDVFTETIVRRIAGAESVNEIEIENSENGESQRVTVQAALIRIGVEPNTEIFRDQINLDEGGYIKIDGKCESSIKGVFAVGDAANPLAPTVSGAVGTGATAAKAIYSFLDSLSGCQ